MPCALLSLEHLSARGTGAHIAAHTAGVTWLALGLGVQVRVYAAPWLSFVLGLTGEVETSRPQVLLDGVGAVETLLPAAASVTLTSFASAWRSAVWQLAAVFLALVAFTALAGVLPARRASRVSPVAALATDG